MITGAAGFVGYHLASRLLSIGHDVLGLDDLNPYYSVALKEARLQRLLSAPRFAFESVDVANAARLYELAAPFRPDVVVHLAARAGVRNPGGDPWSYAHSNLTGFVSALDCCRRIMPRHFIYASSSSVYGSDAIAPYGEGERADTPMSFYAATKRANELMAHASAGLHGLHSTGLRFFTLYGPWGRPDMAYYKFSLEIVQGKPITLHDPGRMWRDFTFIDDAIEAITRLVEIEPDRLPAADRTPHRVFNVGNAQPVRLIEFVTELERVLGRKAQTLLIDALPGEVLVTSADTSRLRDAIGFAPNTPVSEGLRHFASWFRSYHDV